jgi:myosin-5
MFHFGHLLCVLREQYHCTRRAELAPHVYAISAAAYNALIDKTVSPQSQSIIVSGQSGAGKTETVKLLMSHCASIAGKRDSNIVEKLMKSSPLLGTPF